MTLQQLQHFILAAQYKNISRAAEQLFISHSSVSRSITALERELNTTLMDRNSHQVELTEAGRILYEKGARILGDLEELKGEVMQAGGSFVREFHLGSVTAEYPEFFSFYREHFAGKAFTVKLHSGFPSQLFEDVMRGRDDAVLTYSYAYTPSNRVYFEPLQKGSFYAYMHGNHPLAGKNRVTLREIMDYPLYYPKDYADRIFTRGDCWALRSVEEQQVETESQIAMSVRNANAVALLPEHVGRAILPDAASVALSARKHQYRMGLLYRTDNKNPLLMNFLQQIRISPLAR